MRGRWAAGIPPRNFAWVIQGQLAISERPGGYARNHRRVRRHEEILWLREQGFSRVVSLLPSSHNLHAYTELDMNWAHFPLPATAEMRTALPELFGQFAAWLGAGETILVHQEEMGDRLMGVMAGFLVWSGRLGDRPRAISALEQITKRQMGPPGRQLVTLTPDANPEQHPGA
ncbi:MAG: hypothetical protein ACRD0E_12505 [Acidimicrobiales bacterium]